MLTTLHVKRDRLRAGVSWGLTETAVWQSAPLSCHIRVASGTMASHHCHVHLCKAPLTTPRVHWAMFSAGVRWDWVARPDWLAFTIRWTLHRHNQGQCHRNLLITACNRQPQKQPIFSGWCIGLRAMRPALPRWALAAGWLWCDASPLWAGCV